METTLTSNKSLLAWLDEKVELTKPSKIVWIDGSKEQIDALKAEAVETGEMIKLNEELLSAQNRRERRGPCGGQNSDLLQKRRGRRPHQPLDGAL